jgi:hypothetical protein
MKVNKTKNEDQPHNSLSPLTKSSGLIGSPNRGRRENHSERKFMPAAMYFPLTMRRQLKAARKPVSGRQTQHL